MKNQVTSIKKLEHIEDATFDMGNHAYAGFKESSSLASLKGAVSAYRCSMQAIRDKARYNVNIKKSK